MKKLMIALVALALVGGCVKMDKSVPKNMPDYVKIYPGGQPMMHMNMGTMSSETFTTADTPDAVLGFYRTQASTDGLAENAAPATTTAATGQKQASFGDAATGKMLIVIAQPQQSATVVTLMYKPTAQAAS